MAAIGVLLPIAASVHAQTPERAAGSAAAVTSGPPAQDGLERQLAAIRDALLERALEAPTRVLSVGWIDDRGTLHETSQFRTDARVRGVRVLGYLEADGEPLRAQVSTAIDLPASLRAATGAAGHCADVPSRWRTPVALQIVLDPGLRGQDFGTATGVSDGVAALIMNAAANLQRWAVTRSDPHDAAVPSPYLRALSGKGGSPPEWVLRLVLQRPTAAPPRSATQQWSDLATGQGRVHALWPVVLTLQRSDDPDPVYRAHAQIEVTHGAMATGAQLVAHLARRLPEWLAALEGQVPCEPVQFPLLARAPGAWSIEAGASTGLRVGDRVLVVDRRSVPRRMLEPGVARLMAIAEVSRVASDHVRVRQVAGPDMPESGDWVAFPF